MPESPQNGATAPPLPNNSGAERSILGAILLDNRAYETVADKITAQDFFLDQHRRIFERISQLADFHQPIDLVTLSELLSRHGELESAGGPAYLSELMDGMPRATNVEHYARIVKEKSLLRRTIRLANDVEKRAFAGEIDAGKIAALAALNGCDVEAARSMFHKPEDFKNAPPLRFAVDGFLQMDGATLFGGLSGHGKTFVMISAAKALLSGKPLFGFFEVLELSARVMYLIPESAIGPFGHRLRLFGLEPYLENERLLVRTLSLGATPSLSDPRILAAAKGSDVFLDTAVRFMTEGDENNASDSQRGLAQDIFALLRSGARSVVAAHHSAKAFSSSTAISLENVLRGSGDVGAMAVAAFGLKQIDSIQNVIHMECVKSRDFDPVQPFQIAGRPYIDSEGDFRMHKQPGRCGRLADEVPDATQNRKSSGASTDAREARTAKLALMRVWLNEKPELTGREIAARFKAEGIDVAEGSIRRYKSELSK